MSASTNLGLTYLAPGQAQKHVSVNESLRRLDAIIQLSAVSASVNAQPAEPADGGVWILPAGKSGAAWSGYADGALAYYRDGAWVEVTPRAGWLAHVRDTGELLAWTGSAWSLFAPAQVLALSEGDRLVGRGSGPAGPAGEIACTAQGRTLIAATDARAQCAALGTWRVLAASAVPAAHTGSTGEVTLASVAVPAGAMGPNGALRIYSHWRHTNSANVKTPRIRFGGETFTSASQTSSANVAFLTVIQNRGDAAVQVSMPAGTSVTVGNTSNSFAEGAVDTSAAQDVVFSAQLANAGDTLTLEHYIVEVLHGA